MTIQTYNQTFVRTVLNTNFCLMQSQNPSNLKALDQRVLLFSIQ